jgi:uncharacterized protein YjbJ (UPF0337 family)
VGDKTDRVSGQVKEQVGKATGDRDMQEDGRDEQAKGKLKRGAKDIKDAFTK